MKYRALLLCALALGTFVPAAAQDALLPADLFFLDGVGQVWRLAAGGDVLLPVSPEGQVAVDFTVAPDGEGIAYRTAGGAIVRAAAAEDPVEIDSGVVLPGAASVGRTITWSPAGRPLAYTAGDGVRVYLPDGARYLEVGGGPFVDLIWSPGGRYLACEVASGGWIIHQLNPDALALAGTLEGENTVTWTPTEALVVAPAGGGLRLVQIGAGMRTLEESTRQITKPVVHGDSVYYFVHDGGPGAPGTLTRLSLTDAMAAPETLGTLAFDSGAAQWAAGGLKLAVKGDAGLWLVDPVTGEQAPIPNTSGVEVWAWHGGGAVPPAGHVQALPAHLYFLAEETGVRQVWRLSEVNGEPEPVTAASVSIQDFAVSPGGAKVAYTAGGRLVVAPTAGGAGVLVAEVPAGGVSPAFSARSDMLAYAAGGILTVPADGSEQPRGVIGDPEDRQYTRPRWSPDGTWLLIDILAPDGVSEPALLSITGRGPVTFGVRCSGARWITGNKVLCWGAGGAASRATPGLYLVTPGDPVQVETVLGESWSVLDAAYVPYDGTVVFLQGSADAGVSSAQPMRVTPGGTPTQAGVGGLVQEPKLSPGGAVIAGLTGAGPDGGGQLLLIRTEDGDPARLETPARVWSLAWGD